MEAIRDAFKALMFFGVILLVVAFVLGFLSGAAFANDTLNEGPASISAQVGALATLTGEDREVTPTAILQADTPFAIGNLTPARLRVDIGLSAYPGEDLSIEQPETWRAATADLSLYRVVGKLDLEGGAQIETAVIGAWGWASALPREDQDPSPRLARHYGVGALVREIQSGAYLRAIWGRAEEAGEFGFGQIQIKGDLPVPLTNGVVRVVGEAILNAGVGEGLDQKDVFRLGAVVDLVRALKLVKK